MCRNGDCPIAVCERLVYVRPGYRTLTTMAALQLRFPLGRLHSPVALTPGADGQLHW